METKVLLIVAIVISLALIASIVFIVLFLLRRIETIESENRRLRSKTVTKETSERDKKIWRLYDRRLATYDEMIDSLFGAYMSIEKGVDELNKAIHQCSTNSWITSAAVAAVMDEERSDEERSDEEKS